MICVKTAHNQYYSHQIRFRQICNDVGITSTSALSPNEGLIIYNFIIYYYQEFVILANSADPDETPPFVSSHLGLRCLEMFLFACIQPVPQVRTLN